MPPQDPTPLGDEMVERLPERKFPKSDGNRQPPTGESAKAADIASRPALPDHPEPMAADIEDEDADPVIDTGPGIADGLHGLNKQRG